MSAPGERRDRDPGCRVYVHNLDYGTSWQVRSAELVRGALIRLPQLPETAVLTPTGPERSYEGSRRSGRICQDNAGL